MNLNILSPLFKAVNKCVFVPIKKSIHNHQTQNQKVYLLKTLYNYYTVIGQSFI